MLPLFLELRNLHYDPIPSPAASANHLRCDLRSGFARAGRSADRASHLLAEIEQVATHLAIISRGQLRFQGTPAGLQARKTATIVAVVDVSELMRASLCGRCPLERGHPVSPRRTLPNLRRTLENVSEGFQWNNFLGPIGFECCIRFNEAQRLIIGDGDHGYEFPPVSPRFVHDDHQLSRIQMTGKYSVFPVLHAFPGWQMSAASAGPPPAPV
jgi:hypothetical protein